MIHHQYWLTLFLLFVTDNWIGLDSNRYVTQYINHSIKCGTCVINLVTTILVFGYSY